MSDEEITVPAEVEIEPAQAFSPEIVSEETGLLPIKSSIIKQIAELGVQFDAYGVVKMSQGFTFLTQTAMATCVGAILDGLATKEIDPIKAANALGSIAKAMCACNTSNRLAAAPALPAPKSANPATWQPYAKVEFKEIVRTAVATPV